MQTLSVIDQHNNACGVVVDCKHFLILWFNEKLLQITLDALFNK